VGNAVEVEAQIRLVLKWVQLQTKMMQVFYEFSLTRRFVTA